MRNVSWESTHMRDRSHFLIMHNWGRGLNIDGSREKMKSLHIWWNAPCVSGESPVLPYKNDWEGRGDFHSFLYGTTGDCMGRPLPFRQMLSDWIDFWQASMFSALPQSCVIRKWLRSLIWICTQKKWPIQHFWTSKPGQFVERNSFSKRSKPEFKLDFSIFINTWVCSKSRSGREDRAF